MRSVEFDLSAFTEWADKVEDMLAGHRDQFLKEVVELIAAELIARVVKRTPRKTGELRNGWRVREIRKVSDGYEIEIYNGTKYAEPVEYGHRIKNRKGEVTGFKRGVFMLKNTEIEMAFVMPDLIEQKYQEFMEGILS